MHDYTMSDEATFAGCDGDAAAHAEVSELTGHLNVVLARLTVQMATLLDSEGWKVGGKRTPSEYLVWKAGVSPYTARLIVRVAERRADFPQLMTLFDDGQLSLDQAAVGVEAPPWADAQRSRRLPTLRTAEHPPRRAARRCVVRSAHDVGRRIPRRRCRPTAGSRPWAPPSRQVR